MFEILIESKKKYFSRRFERIASLVGISNKTPTVGALPYFVFVFYDLIGSTRPRVGRGSV